MFKKFDTLVSHIGDVETTVKLLSHPNKAGHATIKVLKAGLLDVLEGAVVKDFSVSNGIIKFTKA